MGFWPISSTIDFNLVILLNLCHVYGKFRSPAKRSRRLEYINHNLAPILVATVFGLLVGLGHFLLSKPGERPRLDFLILATIAQFWLAAVLAGALLMAPPSGRPWVSMLVTVFIIWVGLIVPPLMVTLRFRGHPGPMAAADSLHWLLVLLVQASIMLSLGLSQPPPA